MGKCILGSKGHGQEGLCQMARKCNKPTDYTVTCVEFINTGCYSEIKSNSGFIRQPLSYLALPALNMAEKDWALWNGSCNCMQC